MKVSSILGVIGILLGSSPRESHESWMKTRIQDGWTFGETKDFEAKTHPLLIAYDLLPMNQRMKDIYFGNVVMMCVPIGMREFVVRTREMKTRHALNAERPSGADEVTAEGQGEAESPPPKGETALSN